MEQNFDQFKDVLKKEREVTSHDNALLIMETETGIDVGAEYELVNSKRDLNRLLEWCSMKLSEKAEAEGEEDLEYVQTLIKIQQELREKFDTIVERLETAQKLNEEMIQRFNGKELTKEEFEEAEIMAAQIDVLLKDIPQQEKMAYLPNPYLANNNTVNAE